ncbi:hypothetical protein [Streptomyces sp. NPDC008001]|uniref:hypothetical protein n=1 Tax=Streptomyces sp. NPDC008001 TaxID=3364804 RepID=UPI0036ED849E
MKLRPLFPASALGCATAALVLATAGPAAAHGDTIHFTVGAAQPDGRVRAVATWDDDGDPVDEPVAGILTATGPDGRTLGPWQLVAAGGGKAAYTTREALPPGTWKIVVHSGFPDLGHGEGAVTVAAAGEAKSGPVPEKAASAPAKAAAAPEERAKAPSSRTGLTAVAACAAAAVLAAVGGVLLVRARRSGNGRPASV